MEVDPLQDTVPPRHQVESDESDDDAYPYPSAIVRRTVPRSDPKVVVDWQGPQEKRQPLLVTLGEAGRQWTRGVKLGEVKGIVLIDDMEVASAFTPSWAEVIVVCTNLRLPVYSMYAFASTLISATRPTNVVIIDAYPVPAYISPSPSLLYPPIRYLRTTAASKGSPLSEAESFRPPNLIQSPAASFLSILESSSHYTPATLLLLPSAHIPAPAPSYIGGHSSPELQDDWEPSALAKLHKIVGAALDLDSPWAIEPLSEQYYRTKASRRGDIGEGSMYI